MSGKVSRVGNPEPIVDAVSAIQKATNSQVLAVVMVDAEGRVSSIPNPNYLPADVFRALAAQDWGMSARLAEEFS